MENRKTRKTKIGTEVAHVTCDSDTTFKVKRSKVKVTGAGAYCGGLPHSLYPKKWLRYRHYTLIRRYTWSIHGCPWTNFKGHLWLSNLTKCNAFRRQCSIYWPGCSYQEPQMGIILTVASELKSRLTSFCYHVSLPMTRVVHKLERHSSDRIMRKVLSNLMTSSGDSQQSNMILVAPCSHKLITCWTYRTPSV